MCLEAGVNLFDTANIYSDGRSEEVLGEAIKGRRDDLLLATKVRMPAGGGPNDTGLSRNHIVRQCEESLRRTWHRPHRPLPGPRVGRPHPARGDTRGAGHPSEERQGALRGLLQLLGMAAHEGAWASPRG